MFIENLAGSLLAHAVSILGRANWESKTNVETEALGHCLNLRTCWTCRQVASAGDDMQTDTVETGGSQRHWYLKWEPWQKHSWKMLGAQQVTGIIEEQVLCVCQFYSYKFLEGNCRIFPGGTFTVFLHLLELWNRHTPFHLFLGESDLSCTPQDATSHDHSLSETAQASLKATKSLGHPKPIMVSDGHLNKKPQVIGCKQHRCEPTPQPIGS